MTQSGRMRPPPHAKRYQLGPDGEREEHPIEDCLRCWYDAGHYQGYQDAMETVTRLVGMAADDMASNAALDTEIGR